MSKNGKQARPKSPLTEARLTSIVERIKEDKDLRLCRGAYQRYGDYGFTRAQVDRYIDILVKRGQVYLVPSRYGVYVYLTPRTKAALDRAANERTVIIAVHGKVKQLLLPSLAQRITSGTPSKPAATPA